MLSKETCRNLLAYLGDKNKMSGAATEMGSVKSGFKKKEHELVELDRLDASKGNARSNTEKLQVIKIKELLDVLSTITESGKEREDAINTIKGLNGYIFYD